MELELEVEVEVEELAVAVREDMTVERVEVGRGARGFGSSGTSALLQSISSRGRMEESCRGGK